MSKHKGNYGMDSAFTLSPTHMHPATVPVKVGDYEVYLGALRDIDAATVGKMDYVCALNGDLPKAVFGSYTIHINCALPDYGGVPDYWPTFINNIIGHLAEGHKVLAYCTGSHGRTGCFLASLISVLEPNTPDPIDAARVRHCYKAVESRKQACAIYALRGKKLPARYNAEFKEYKPAEQSLFVPGKGTTSFPGI